jgi:RNA polymerase sigma factor (sigma-70 family)
LRDAKQTGRPMPREGIVEALALHEAALVRFTLSITRDIETARDVVQDAFVKLIETPSPPQASRVRAWLFSVCRNRAIDILRKGKRMNAWNDEMPPPPSAEPNPAVALEAEEASRYVLAAVGDLPASQREVIQLRFQGQLRYREIAEVTGLTVSHVGVLIHTAMGQLRARFAEDGWLDGKTDEK